MAVISQVITDRYAIYNGDSAEMLQSVPSESVHLCIHSPPFATENGGCLYNYSSSVRDLSNARTYEEFFDHYGFIVREIHRTLKPGRICAVHCMDVPKDGANVCGFTDFPGDIIRLYREIGFEHLPRITVWKEPLAVRNRTMSKALAHRQIVEDATQTNIAAADYVILFRKRGENPEPVTHPTGFHEYFGEREIPAELLRYKGWKGNQIQNKYSHWIWRHYASSVWDDIRIDRTVPYREARDGDDERHQHPLQLDVIQRLVDWMSNPGDVVLTPFMGVGSELVGALLLGRRGIGCELKTAYFNQTVRNLEDLKVLDDTDKTKRLWSEEELAEPAEASA